MASAVLASRNEANWSHHQGFVSKFTNNPNFTRFNPNSNPNPSCFFSGNPSGVFLGQNHEQKVSSFAPPPAAAFTGSSVNSVLAKSYGHMLVTFHLGSYTRRELKELKKQLISDLDRVRILRRRISSPPVPEKMCRPPKPELSRPPVKKSEKSAVGQKRTTPYPLVRDTKKQCGGVKNNAQKSKVVMRKCGQILAKLMKHKHGWVFNTPVNAVALGLYDYHNVIKNPMDLGTIKSKLGRNEYKSPLAFASDVRLTFQNAMVYNDKGSDVYVMAELLLSLFEGMFNQAYQKFSKDQVKKPNRCVKVPVVVEKPVSNVGVELEKPMSIKAANFGDSMGRDVNKREMTVEEKSELAASLLNMQKEPEEVDQIMAILRKGVSGLGRKGDEFELDLDVLDSGTMWELDSFIASSRVKAADIEMMERMITDLVSPVHANNVSPAQEEKRDGGEEEIDIGEEIPIANYHSVEIEKDAVNVSSSSSSSSSGSDSSSSDSDSSSSSGDDSDEEEAHSAPPPQGASMGI